MKTKLSTNPTFPQKLDPLDVPGVAVEPSEKVSSSSVPLPEAGLLFPGTTAESKSQRRFAAFTSAAITAVLFGAGLLTMSPPSLAAEMGATGTPTAITEPAERRATGTPIDLRTVEPRQLLQLVESVIGHPSFIANNGGRHTVQRLYGDLARDVAVAIDNLRDYPRSNVYAGGVLVAGEAVTQEARQRPFVAWKSLPAETTVEEVALAFAALARSLSTLDEGALRGAIAKSQPFQSGHLPGGESFTLAVKPDGDSMQLGIAVSVKDFRRFQDAPVDDATYAARVTTHIQGLFEAGFVR